MSRTGGRLRLPGDLPTLAVEPKETVSLAQPLPRRSGALLLLVPPSLLAASLLLVVSLLRLPPLFSMSGHQTRAMLTMKMTGITRSLQ
jgi:hypothetical protein